MKIENGWGDSTKLRITEDGQALTQSENHTEARHHSGEGEVFFLASGFATTATSADDYTNIFYLKNDSTTKSIHIGYLRTCNEVAGKWRLLDAPTALGTTAITAYNANRAKTQALDATSQSFSAAGTTFTDGTSIGQWVQNGPGHSVFPFDGSYILGPNSSLGLEFAPFGTTAGDACVTVQCWQTVE